MPAISSDAAVHHILPAVGQHPACQNPMHGPLPAYDPQACRALMRGGSKSFFAASLLLPARICAPARALYAYCRLADD